MQIVNGQSCPQPASPAGKWVCSLDRLPHSGRPSMNARTVVLPNEDAHEYASLLDSYIQDILPSPVEMDLSNVEDSTTALLVRPEAWVPMLLAANVNAKWRQRHETVYTRALNTLLRLRHLLESNPGAANKDSEKRTESQERTLSVYLSSQTQHEQIPPAPPPHIRITSPRSSDPAAEP